MKHWRKGLKRITAVALAVMMIGTTVDPSALTVLAAAEAECTCETDDPAFHATNCPAYIAPENPQCTCAEKCTDDTLNVWCDVCGVQGVSACQGEDTAVVYTDVVASITNGETVTNYATFDEALANWTNNTTLTLLADVTLTERIKTYTKGLSLDLNGHKIECSDTLCTIWIDGDSGSELTIRDSQDGGHINGNVYAVGGGSKLCLESGTVETVLANGDFTMTGGRIISEDGSGLSVNGEVDIVISGGEIYGSEYGVLISHGNVIISGDTKITGADQYAIRSISSAEVVISGTPTISGGAGEFILDSKITLNTQPADGKVWRVKTDTEEITDGIFAVPGEGIALDASRFASTMDGYEVKQNAKGELLLCNHTEQTAASNGDGTHNTTCNCGEATFDTNVACSGGVATDTHQAYCEYCNAPYGELNPDVNYDIIAPTMTTEELEDALLELLNSGETDISIVLAAKADEEMFTAINTALCSSTAVNGSVNLTIAGVQVVTTIALGNGDPDPELNTDPVALKTLNFPDAVTLERNALSLPSVQAVYLPKVTEWEIWGIWNEDNISTLVLTAPGSITADFTELSTYDIDLKLHCNKKNDVTDGTTWQGKTWKSISFAHSWTNGTCISCGESCDHKDSDHTTVTNNGNGTHSFTCTVCNDVVIQECTDEYSVVENKITKKCTACGEKGYIIITAEGGIYDGTTAYGATVEKTGIFENEEVTVYYYQGDTLIGTDAPVNAGTYTAKITYEDVTASYQFTIEKATSVISAAPTPIADLVYDGTAQNLINAGTTTDGEMQYSLDGTNYSSTIPTGTDAGEYTVWYKVDGDENHNDTEPASIEVSIAPKSITVTADNASKIYGENDPTFTYTATGLEGSDTLTGTLSRETGENAGTYAITQGTLANPNYEITLVEGTFTINKATPPALTIPTATTITYGEKLSASTLSDSSWAWVDGTIVPNAITYYNAYIEVDDSNYDYTDVNGYDSANHRVVRGVDVIISRATLTITAKSYTIKVGEALPTYEYTVTGLVGDDTLPVDVTVSCSAADSNAAGTYPITISGVASDALASLYAPFYVNGKLTITEKEEQKITASDVTLTYGETKNIGATTNGNGAITYSTTSDVISVAADGTITALKAGTATVTITTAETADYAEATKTISVTVNKKKIAVPAVDTSGYIYTGTAQTYGVTSTDDYTVEGGVQTNAGEYPVTITLNNENYEWDGTLGTYEFVINKVAITVTAKNYSIKVSETLPTYAYEVAGLVNGETLPIDVAISCNATNSNTAGTYTITVSGAANSANYLFTYVNGTLIVSNKEEQTITASDVTLTYGETGKKISATTNGDGAITYTVATGTDVISVAADGSITVLKAGTATVTIRAAETADYAEAIKTISVTVSACSHRYTSKVTKQPSYTEKGERTYTCNCGHSYTEEIPKLQPSSGGNNGGGGGTSGSGTPEPTATPIPTATPKPTPAPEKLPQIQDEDGKSGWDVIGDEIEKVIEDAKDSEEKAVVTVDMNGVTKVPKDIFEQIAGKDVSVEFILDNGLKWTVNGKTVNTEDLKEIDFAVTVESEENPIDSIPVKVINMVTGERSSVALQLAHSGEFGFEAVLTVDLKEKNAGLYANLFFYNEDAEELEFIYADVIAKDGTADLTFTHASDYLIVLSETSMEPKDEVEVPEEKAPVLKKGYTVQIGAFSREANAKKWEQKGEAIDIPMFIIKDGKYFKVQTDVFETGEEAVEVSKKLAAAGLDNFVLKTERLVTPGEDEMQETPTKPTTPVLPAETDKKKIEALAKEVIDGKWGNGKERKDRLTKAGHDYREVQDKVNELLR